MNNIPNDTLIQITETVSNILDDEDQKKKSQVYADYNKRICDFIMREKGVDYMLAKEKEAYLNEQAKKLDQKLLKDLFK